MPVIIPIKDLKNTSEISELCHKTKEPVFVTKNGYGDMVIMSMETYEELKKKQQVIPAAAAAFQAMDVDDELRFGVTEAPKAYQGTMAETLAPALEKTEKDLAVQDAWEAKYGI